MGKLNHINRRQLENLLKFMQIHSDLARGRPSNRSRACSNDLWENLTDKMNRNGPPVRTSKEWKKVWSDYKYNVKRKLKHNKKAKNEQFLRAKELSKYEEIAIDTVGISIPNEPPEQLIIKQEHNEPIEEKYEDTEHADTVHDDPLQHPSLSISEHFMNDMDSMDDELSRSSAESDILSNNSIEAQIEKVNQIVLNATCSNGIKDEFLGQQSSSDVLSELKDIKSLLLEHNNLLSKQTKLKEEKLKYYKNIESKRLKLEQAGIKIKMLKLELLKKKMNTPDTHS